MLAVEQRRVHDAHVAVVRPGYARSVYVQHVVLGVDAPDLQRECTLLVCHIIAQSNSETPGFSNITKNILVSG